MEGLKRNLGLGANSAFRQQIVHSSHRVYSNYIIPTHFSLQRIQEDLLPLPLLIVKPLRSLDKDTALKMFHIKTYNIL
jgi:hypothetical protein